MARRFLQNNFMRVKSREFARHFFRDLEGGAEAMFVSATIRPIRMPDAPGVDSCRRWCNSFICSPEAVKQR